MTCVVGLVTEGPNDQIVFEKVILSFWMTYFGHRNVIFRRLNPPSDRTSEGGWCDVRNWLLRNSESDRQHFFFSPGLTAEAPACDFIVIQIDADCLQSMAHSSMVEPLDTPAPPRWKLEYCKYILCVWADISDISDPNMGPYILVGTVQALETWICKAMDPEWVNPEYKDPQSKLIQLRPDMEDSRRKGKLKKKRTRRRYERFAEEVSSALTLLEQSCLSFQDFLEELRYRGK